VLHHIKVHFNKKPAENLAHEAWISVHPGETRLDAIYDWTVKVRKSHSIYNLHIVEDSIGRQVRDAV